MCISLVPCPSPPSPPLPHVVAELGGQLREFLLYGIEALLVPCPSPYASPLSPAPIPPPPAPLPCPYPASPPFASRYC